MKPFVQIALAALVIVGVLVAHADDDKPKLKGDGVSDDYAAIQKLLDDNAGGTVLLPEQRAKGADYFCSKTLMPKGAGQVFRGETAGWGGGTTIKFPPGVSGILLRNDLCPGAQVRDLVLAGSEPWNGTIADEAVLPEGFGGGPNASSADGIKVAATFARIENVYVWYFGRHGFNVGDGQQPKDAPGNWFGDSFYMANCTAQNNRGCGLYVSGGDSNAGTTVQFRASVNQLWGMWDSSFLGNTHVSPTTHTNHVDLTPGKAATKVWETAGDAGSGGPYRGADVSNIGNVWLCPYYEGDQPPSRFGGKDVVIGGNAGLSAPTSHSWLDLRGIPFIPVTNGRDDQGVLSLKAGKTKDQESVIRAENLDGSPRWDMSFGAGKWGWMLWEGRAWAGATRINVAPNGEITLNSRGNAPVRINADPGAGSGGLVVGDGSGKTVAYGPGQAGGTGPPGPRGPAGPQGAPGPPGMPPPRIQRTAKIPPGRARVTVAHGLKVAPLDVALGVGNSAWVAAVNNTDITFETVRPAPASGLTFTYSVSKP